MTFNTVTPVDTSKVVDIRDVEGSFRKGRLFVKRDRAMQPLADELVTLPEGKARELKAPTILHQKAVNSLRSVLADMGYTLNFRQTEKAQYFWATKRDEQWYAQKEERSRKQRNARTTVDREKVIPRR